MFGEKSNRKIKQGMEKRERRAAVIKKKIQFNR